ncbi:hypothetical protein O3M35_011124 [Rhynocoris fuscipes]|uniref:Maturase K n=1 Tax=Rhynocoris fuscipes TaxID=488301 RepID=A0AAW1CV68_9HEMI
MDNSRLPKIVLDRLKYLDENGIKIKYNWYTAFKSRLLITNSTDFLTILDRRKRKEENKNIIERTKNHFISVDIDSVCNSHFNPLYREISSLGPVEPYLTIRGCISRKRLISHSEWTDRHTDVGLKTTFL